MTTLPIASSSTTSTATEAKTELKKPTYPIITSIKIDESVLISIIKLKQNPKTEGILFGRETANEVQVTSVIPFSINDSNISNLISYLEVNRLDYMQVGFFFCNEQSTLITENNLKVFIEFQKTFPNAIVLCLDINMLNVNCYPFKCFRLSQGLMDLVDICEIEDDVYYQQALAQGQGQGQGQGQEDNGGQSVSYSLFKKFVQSEELMHMLSFNIIEDKTSLFSVLSNKEINDKIEGHGHGQGSVESQQPFNYSVNRKINELNKNCEKFIEEQKKYINYYKVKKTYGKKREKEFLELMTKKGNELSKLNKTQISIESKNILNMNQQLKTMLNQNEITNYLNLNLA